MIIDKHIIEELEDVLEEKVQDIAVSIYGVLAEYNMHEKEPYIGEIVESELEDLKEFIVNLLTKYIKQ